MQLELEHLSSSTNEPVFSHPNVWAWNSSKQRVSPRVGKVCQQGLSARLASNMNTFQWSPHTVISPVSPRHTHANQCSKSNRCRAVLLHFPLLLCLGEKEEIRVAHSALAKPLQLKRLAHASMYPRAPLFFLEHCSLLLQAKRGRMVTVERNSLLLCCVLSSASCGQSCIVLVLIHVCQE